jgi:hypothetical protein
LLERRVSHFLVDPLHPLGREDGEPRRGAFQVLATRHPAQLIDWTSLRTDIPCLAIVICDQGAHHLRQLSNLFPPILLVVFLGRGSARLVAVLGRGGGRQRAVGCRCATLLSRRRLGRDRVRGCLRSLPRLLVFLDQLLLQRP